MAIQWFPGHMNKAKKQIAETMAKVDMVIEVLDARLPRITTNPLIHELRLHRQRPSLKVLNKADLADPDVTAAWVRHFRQQPDTAVITLDEGGKSRDAGKLLKLCRELVPHRTGGEKPVRAMILGVPNVGKSTLINALAKRKLAKVADTPGVTQTQQRIELPDGTVLVDTPGMMWPKIMSNNDGYKLALSGTIGRNAFDAEDVAWYAMGWLALHYSDAIRTRYRLADLTQPGDVLFEQAGRAMGYVLPGNRIDGQKTAERILTDFRAATLGRISLERPNDALDLDLGEDDADAADAAGDETAS
ncbi:ribosome biogenesis GTPase YlqF [Chitinimonas koreensis]|uniref:ribosome biogenesis GTPase YlqF n=1 Tax=Chitinimonas koreensis TaxID=356302 RepID=UPI000416CBE1|nr:ribosome biogenesis GTPase YlqF [Chitinimonas koreensis]QNM96632.1 ribosome biogenesis GTPase YlqF [Chitinimonas koreensis]